MFPLASSSSRLYFKQQQLMKYSEEHFTEKYKYYFCERYYGSVQILDSYKKIMLHIA